MIDDYKISAEEFAKTSFSRIATRPNSRTAGGEGQMSAEELKKRFDRQGELFRAKFNAFLSLVEHVGEGDSLSAHIHTGIGEDHTLKALFEDIVSESGRFASYLSVGDQTLLEKLIEMSGSISNIKDEFSEHLLEDNPHKVTAAQVGLGNVDNRSDADKPISVAQRAALDALASSIENEVAARKAALQQETDARMSAVSGRVPRQSTSGASVYVTDDESGTSRKAVALRRDANGDTIPIRDTSGNLSVGTATAPSHAVNKEVLDDAVALLVAKSGNQVIDGDLSLSGNLYVVGSTYAADVGSLNVKDAVIVANADGVPLAGLSGYVIRVSATEAYGILYDAGDQCVKIGRGSFNGQVFVYGTDEAQVLATRGNIPNGNVPVWNGEKNTFEDSGKKMSDKLDVSTAVSSVYATDADGKGRMLTYSSEAVPDTILVRDKDGRAKIEDPVDDKDIANRGFVLAYGGGTIRDEEGNSLPYSISIKDGYPCMTLQVAEETED